MFEFAASMFIIGIGVVFAVTFVATQPKELTDEQKYGPIDPELTCVRCGADGGVHERTVTVNDGISTPKLVAGALTGGLAFLAIGVHRRRAAMQRHCAHCGGTWTE